MKYCPVIKREVPSSRDAFTLLELLVVITIIAILAAILFPVFGKVRSMSKRTTCISNMKQIGTAIAMYTDDYDGCYPNTGDPYLWVGKRFRWPIMPYLGLGKVQSIPASVDSFLSINGASSLLLCPEDTSAKGFDYTSYAYAVPFYQSDANLATMTSIQNLIQGFAKPGSLANPVSRTTADVTYSSRKVMISEWTNNHDYTGPKPVGMWGTLVSPFDTPGVDCYNGGRVMLFADLHAKFIKANAYVKKPEAKLNAPDPNLTSGGLGGYDVD